MKWSVMLGVVGLALLVVQPATADWHGGDYILSHSNGNEAGKQTFNVKRSSETGKLFMASKATGEFPGGKGKISGAIEIEADGQFKKYSTVRRRTNQKPERGIFFMFKGKLRAIAIKGSTKPEDFERPSEDLLVLDGRLVSFWNLVAMRTVGKVGLTTLSYFDSVGVGVKNLTVENKGTSGVDRKGKFVELTLLAIGGDAGSWTIAATKEGKVYGGTNGNLVFALDGVDMAPVFKRGKTTEKPAEEEVE